MRNIAMTGDKRTRVQQLGYRKPDEVAEPDQLVLVEYVSDGRVAIVTLNRPHADNAITTELAVRLIESLETISARPSVRVAILTGAGDRAFSVGGDLRQRKAMTKENWLRQRQVFDRVLYTLRQLSRPIIAAVHGMAYGGGCEIAISTDFIIASDDGLWPARSDGWPERGRRRTGLPATRAPTRESHADAYDRRADHCKRGAQAWHGQRTLSQGRADGCRATPRRDHRG
jgi:hypothetical protein